MLLLPEAFLLLLLTLGISLGVHRDPNSQILTLPQNAFF